MHAWEMEAKFQGLNHRISDSSVTSLVSIVGN